MKIADLKKKKARTSAQAEKEKNQLEDLKAQLTKQIEELEARIPEETEKAGDEVLESLLNGQEKTELTEINKLENQLKAKKQALQRVDELLSIAQNNLKLATAKENRQKAEDLRKQAEERAKTTNDLLKQLSDFEGCEYAPKRPDIKQAQPVAYVAIPKTKQMLNEAQNLETEATRMETEVKENREIPKHHDIIGNIEKMQKAV